MANDVHAYTLEVLRSLRPGHFQWAIRRSGELIQRADRLHASEEAARKYWLEQIERLVHQKDERG
jgi:hypothetical protein